MSPKEIRAKIKDLRESAGLLAIMPGGDTFLTEDMVKEKLSEVKKLERMLESTVERNT